MDEGEMRRWKRQLGGGGGSRGEGLVEAGGKKESGKKGK